jgi:hypothetical protein
MLRHVAYEIIIDDSEIHDASILRVEDPSALMMKAISFFSLSETFITIYYLDGVRVPVG